MRVVELATRALMMLHDDPTDQAYYGQCSTPVFAGPMLHQTWPSAKTEMCSQKLFPCRLRFRRLIWTHQ